VRLTVRNVGSSAISDLTIVDRIGDAILVAYSAAIDGNPCEPLGTRQLAFSLPALAPGAFVAITYQLWSQAK